MFDKGRSCFNLAGYEIREYKVRVFSNGYHVDLSVLDTWF